MYTKAFWKQAGERAAKSGVQYLALTWGFSNSGPINAFELDYQLGLGSFLGGVLISLATSIVSAPVGADSSPSLVKQ
jgi:hypothetical protein